MAMDYTVNLTWDPEANVWVAINDEIPIALESESIDELIRRVKLAIPEMMELNNRPKGGRIFLVTEVPQEVVA